MKNFYDLAELSIDEIESLISQAKWLENQGSSNLLQGKVLALLFLNHSLRTLTSFQAAMIRLGGGTFVVSPEMSIHKLESRSGIIMDGTAAEHIREAVPVIASYADAIGIRAIAPHKSLEEDLRDEHYKELCSFSDISVINLESSIHHPCQSLADWKTLDDLTVPRQGGKFVFCWVYHPDAQPLSIPGDTIHMAAARGMDVTVLRPEGFGLPKEIIERAETAASLSGGSVTETNDVNSGLAGANVVYAGSWSSTSCYGDHSMDQKTRNEFTNWKLDESWFKGITRDSCYFMHALPVRRGVEVEDQILDGPRSVVVKQAQNRMYTQMSVLLDLLG